MATLELAEAHAATVEDVVTLAVADLVREWDGLDHANAAATTQAAKDLSVALVDEYGTVLGGYAADWYEDVRADAGVTTRFVAAPGSLPPVEQVVGVAGYAMGPLWSERAPDPGLALSKLSGGLQRMVVNADRSTVIENVRRDPAAQRWFRYASANACAFCSMLAGVARYREQSTADFKPHDDCHCTAVPTFAGAEPELPDYYADWQAGYSQVADELRAAGLPVNQANVLPRLRKTLGKR